MNPVMTPHREMKKSSVMCRSMILVMAATTLSGCNLLNRLSDIGAEPQVSAITNPTHQPEYQPVTMPMPAPQPAMNNPSSLWRTGAKGFFKDTRASDVGDLITIVITIADTATISNQSTRARTNTHDMSASALFGYETKLADIFPEEVVNTDLIETDGALSNDGQGAITRSDAVNLRVAGSVTQVLPNGNMVVRGHQEVRVNCDVKILEVDGIIRRADITTTNTVSYDQIAEARITYGGRGQLNDMQQPPYGSQFLDVILPF